MGHKYKDKYISVRDIYKNIKSNIYKNINYGLYYSIVKRFFEILIRDVVERDREVYLPNKMGYIYIDERPHIRAFHYNIDNKASKIEGKIVRNRVPILDDFYKKLIWVRPSVYKKCKFMPLGYSKNIINNN